MSKMVKVNTIYDSTPSANFEEVRTIYDSKPDSKKNIANQIQQDIADKINYRFKPPASKNDIVRAKTQTENKERLRTTIPSRTYDATYVPRNANPLYASSNVANKPMLDYDINTGSSEIDNLQSVYDIVEKRNAAYIRAKNELQHKKWSKTKIEQAALLDETVVMYDEQLKSLGYKGATDNNTVNQLKKELNEKKQFHNQSKVLQKGVNLTETAITSKDFEKKGMVNADFSKDEKYKYINDIGGYRDIALNDYYNQISTQASEHNGVAYVPKPAVLENNYSYMTDEEVKIYNYYYATKGAEKANEYLEVIQRYLNERASGDIVDLVGDSNIAKVAYGGYSELKGVGDNIKNLLGPEKEYYAPSAQQLASQKIRQSVDGAWGVAYDVAGAVGGMLPSVLTSTVVGFINPAAGAAVGSAIIGASSESNAYSEMINLGYDKSQAKTYAGLVGSSEALLQYLLGGIGKLGGKITGNAITKIVSGIDNAFAKFAIKWGASAIAEGIEESSQSLLEPLFENIAAGYDVNTWEDVDWSEVIYSGLLGMLTGGLFELAPSATETYRESAEAKSFYGDTKENTQALINEGKAMPQDSRANKLAQKYQQQFDKKGDLSGAKLHNLVEANEQAMLSADKTKIKAAAEQRLSMLGEKFDKGVLADIIVKEVSGETVTNSERAVLNNSVFGNRVLNELTPTNIQSEQYSSDWVKDINTDRINSETYSLQQTSQDDIINQGGEKNELPNQRTIGRSIEKGMDSRGKSQMGKSYETIDGYVQGGKAEILSGGAEEVSRRVRINHTENSNVTFTEGKVDDTEGYKAYTAFANAGIKVIYCDGMIERTVNGVTVTRTEAFTAPDGTVYVSSESSLPAKQTFDHEKVHVAQKTNNPAYMEYESALCESAIYYSSTYFGLAEDINKYQFNNKYDIEDISTSSVFMREIAAYMNQFVLSDPAFAEQTFGGMFSDWEAVVEAVNKFNTDMGADFTESANFMPENETSGSGEFGFSEPTDQEIYRDPTDEENAEAIFGKRKNAKQRHILDVAKKLDSGVKVVFVSGNAKVLSGQKGVYMRESNTMYLSESNSVVESYYQVFKHEFIHRLESKGAYQSFKNYLFKHSPAFEKYARAQLGESFKGTREEALQAFAQKYIDTVQNGSFSKAFKDGFTVEDAQYEMVADFISEVLFKGNRADVAQNLADSNIEAIFSIEDTLLEFESLSETDRTWFQKIIDAIRDFIASLKGVKQNERLVNDLEYIEKRLARVLDSKDTKKAANNSGGVQYHLNAYSEHQIENWKNSKNIVVYKNEHQLRKFIVNAQKGINLNEKMYFGAISQELADRIRKDTGLDVNRYNCTLRASEIRKILNDHGNEEKEALRGQRAITEDDFVLIPQIIQSPDKIVLSDELFEGKPVIHFVKTINGKTTIAAYVSAKHLDLTVQTMYSGKNKGNLSIAAGEQAPANTPEANAGTVSNNSVPQEMDTVNSNSMQETEDYSENLPEGKHSFSLGSPAQQMRDNLKKYESGEITREEYLEETDRLWGKANETYGAFETGENAKAPIATPTAVAEDKPTERFTRTIIETGKLTEEMLQGMEEKVLLGDFSYEVVSDEKALQKADKAVNNGTAEDIWEETLNGSKITKNQMAIGERLLKDAMESGNTKRVLELSAELADIFTRAGQVVQAARLLKKMTGAGRLVSLQRTVKTLNSDLRQKYGEDMPPIKISPETAKRLAEAKTKGGIEYAYEEAMYEVARQMPVTFLDKWNAWRYFAMLSNPKTHIRNIVGNAIFVPVVHVKNFIAAVAESGMDQSKRTKSIIIKKEYRDFAKKDSNNVGVKNLLKGNKYNDKSALKEKQRIFKTEMLEFLTRTNSNLLEAEDMLFKNKHYIHALAGFLQARKVDLGNVSQEVLDEARIYAVKEAKKATFNDESALANWIQNFGNKNLATSIAVEGVLPFKRTPINIVKRGIEYSPIGLTETLTKGLYDVKKGKITVTEFIDGLASGLTGTGIMLVGMFLANLGLVTGGEDDDEKSLFEKWLGKQEYAVEILGKSYTVDWAAPANIPFFVGVEIINTLNEGEEFSLSQLSNAVWNSLEPITNLSMLSGMQGVIESARYADSAQTLSAIAVDALTSYGMQGVPSLSGAVARTIDPTQRSWYTDKNDKWLDSTVQTVKNNIQSKVPGLSYTQIPKIDMWGREVSRGGTAERVLENFASPGYYSKIEVTETSEELKRIFNETDQDVFPNIAAKSFKVGGETKHLTAREYVTYAKAKGSYSYEYIKEFMEATAYKKLTDKEKADVITKLYEYANAKAKAIVSDYDLMKNYKTVTQWEQNGRSAIDYYIFRAINK